MPQKVKQINGFSLFVEQVIKRNLERDHGRSVSMLEAINHGDPIWKRMSPEERDEWKQRAKTHKVSAEFQAEKQLHKERYYRQREQLSDPMAARLNKKSKSKSGAVRVDELERMSCRYYDDVDEENFRQKRERDRNNMDTHFIWQAPQDDIGRRKWIQERRFHVLSAAAYCETREREFPPSEMSVVSFSFNDGVTNVKHWLIDHGIAEWTDPDAYDAAQQNEVNTGIPADGMRSALLRQYGITNNYVNILETLVHKFEGDKHVFVHRRDWNTVMGCLHWLKDNCSLRSPSNFSGESVDDLSEDRFVCIEDLFLAVTKFLNFDVTSTLIADVDEKLDAQWETYMMSEHVLCQYHYSRVRMYPQQGLRCSLACARRYTFSLFDMANTGNYFPDMRLGPNHFPVHQSTATHNEEENNEYGENSTGAIAAGFQSSEGGFGVRPIGFNQPSQVSHPADATLDDVRSDDSFDDELDEELGYSNHPVMPVVLDVISFGEDDDDDFPPRPLPARPIATRVVQPPRPPPSGFSGFSDLRPTAASPNDSTESVRPFSSRNAFSVDQNVHRAQMGLSNVQLGSNSSSVAGSSGLNPSVESQPLKPKSKPKTLPPSVLSRITAASRSPSSMATASSSTSSTLGSSSDPNQRQAPRGLGRGMLTDDAVAKFF